MLHIKFQASVPSGSEEADFLFFFLCISMIQTWDSLVQDHLGPWDICLNKLGKGPLGNASIPNIPNYKHLSQVVLRRRFLNIFMYFYCLNL